MMLMSGRGSFAVGDGWSGEPSNMPLMSGRGSAGLWDGCSEASGAAWSGEPSNMSPMSGGGSSLGDGGSSRSGCGCGKLAAIASSISTASPPGVVSSSGRSLRKDQTLSGGGVLASKASAAGRRSCLQTAIFCGVALLRTVRWAWFLRHDCAKTAARNAMRSAQSRSGAGMSAKCSGRMSFFPLRGPRRCLTVTMGSWTSCMRCFLARMMAHLMAFTVVVGVPGGMSFVPRSALRTKSRAHRMTEKSAPVADWSPGTVPSRMANACITTAKIVAARILPALPGWPGCFSMAARARENNVWSGAGGAALSARQRRW